jgi:hypothetical protein
MKRNAAVVLALALGIGGTAVAQSTLMPYYYAPYRAFEHHEVGGTISFPNGGVGFEGLYGFGKGRFDIGIRGGVFEPEEGSLIDTRILAGVSGRGMFVLHSEDFPLDGSAVVGIGTWSFDNIILPAGLTFGRRIDIEDSQISLVPYGQPTLIITADSDDTDVLFAMGLGLDARVSSVLDLRLSIGLGDIEGVSISAVWVK